MSVKIVINSGGVFENPTAQQSDLVFWFNDDTQPHYPVPGCTGLRVAPGATTPKYQPAPVPTIPVTIDYTCALHPSETGQLTVNPDSTGPVTGTPAGNTNREIAIDSGGSFATVDITQSDTVTWVNHDTREHFPVPNCFGLLVEPQAVSNALQPAPTLALPMSLAYGCAIAGHESEQGMINVYNDFVAAGPVTLSTALPYVAVAAATGGKSPYRIVQDPNVPYITAAETTPAGSSTGISIILNAAPPGGTTAVNYQLDATDALGTQINTTIAVTLS